MTSYDLKRIIAEELAQLRSPLAAFDRGSQRVDFDGVIPGFGVRTHASGRQSYIVQTRIGGRMRTITIGNTAILDEAVARDVARRVILRIHLGMNPAEQRSAARNSLIFEQFIELYWQTCSPNWKPSTQKADGCYRRNIVEPGFRGRFIDEITHADAVRWHAQVTRSNGPGAANRAMEIARCAFNKAEQWGYLAEHSNPFLGIKRNRSRKIERFLTEDEMSRIGPALNAERKVDPYGATAIILLALTGCRRGEICNLTWAEVKGARLKLADSKTGPRIVWLGAEARALLAALPRVKGDPRVFPVRGVEGRIFHLWVKVKKEAGVSNLRMHDLRHSYASFAARQSETLPMIGNLLGHARVSTTNRYAH